MFKRFSANYMAVICVADILIIQFSLWLALQMRYILPFGQEVRPEWASVYFYSPSLMLHFAIGVLWLGSFMTTGIYAPRKVFHWFDEAQRVLLAHTIAALSFAGLLYIANIELLRLVYLYFYLIALFGLLGFRWTLRAWHRLRRSSSRSVARILVVGAGEVGIRTVGEFQKQNWPGITFVGFLDDDLSKQGTEVCGLPVLGPSENAVQIIQDEAVDEVIVALPSHAHNRLTNLVTNLYETPVRIRIVPDYFELAFFGATVESLGGIPLIGLRDSAIDGIQRFVKRIVDIVVSACGLILLTPVMAVIVAMIKLEDRGPVFYHALRVGENGRLFRMHKFRSMVVDADSIQIPTVEGDNSIVHHKRPDDPRVTQVGRFIRRTSLDEIPQLFNVLIGEMSLVGPRPELPWLVARYEPWQRKRFAVPQGITGWWQVNGRSDNAMHLHTDQDLYYIRNYSLWLDMQILWRTVAVVVRGKGAY